MSELLHHDDDDIGPNDGRNDINVSRMVPNGLLDNDFTIGRPPAFQLRIRDILHEFNDIFSNNVREWTSSNDL